MWALYYCFYCLIKLINKMMSQAKRTTKSSKKRKILNRYHTMTPVFREENLSQKKKYIYWNFFFFAKTKSNQIKISRCHTKSRDLFTWCSQYDGISFTFHVMVQLWQWLVHYLKKNQKVFTANGFESIVPSLLMQYHFVTSMDINMLSNVTDLQL